MVLVIVGGLDRWGRFWSTFSWESDHGILLIQALVGALYPCENRSLSLVPFRDHLYLVFINVFINLLLYSSY